MAFLGTGRSFPPGFPIRAGVHMVSAEEDTRQSLHIVLATEYVRAVKFFKLNTAPEGHWQQFFSADEIVFMASVLAIDTGAMLTRFEARLLASTTSSTQPSAPRSSTTPT